MRCKSALLSLIFPGLLVALPVVGGWLWASQPNVITPLLPTIAGFLLVSALVVSWRFSCSRLLLVCVLVVIHESVLTWAPGFYPGWRLLVPLNLLALALLKERPVISLAMLGRTVLIVAQPVVLYGLMSAVPEFYQTLIGAQWTFAFPVLDISLTMDVYSVVVSGAAVVLLLLVAWQSTLERTVLVWALVLLGAAQLPAVQPLIPVLVFHGLLMLILLVSVLERSHALAFRDELTNLPSRRAFLDHLNRRSSGYRLALVDIDHFKKVNDTHGHDVGDQVLKLVATRLAAVAAGGKAFRYGGEEFMLVFYRRDPQAVTEAVEKLRQQIADTPFALRQLPRPAKRPRQVVAAKTRPQTLRVTVSIGVAQWQKGLDLDAVVKKADQALYKAKKTGRNRVVNA